MLASTSRSFYHISQIPITSKQECRYNSSSSYKVAKFTIYLPLICHLCNWNGKCSYKVAEDTIIRRKGTVAHVTQLQGSRIQRNTTYRSYRSYRSYMLHMLQLHSSRKYRCVYYYYKLFNYKLCRHSSNRWT